MESNRLFMGIDVSKGYADFVALTSKRELFDESFQLDDTQGGHKILEGVIQELTAKGYCVICGVENTGGYERNWIQLLKKLSKSNKKIEAYKLNPKAVKHQIQSLLKRTIDDAVSAEGIAMYMVNNYEVFKQNWANSTNQGKTQTDGQQVVGMICGLIKQQTMKKNQLEKMLYQTFPEILPYMKNSTPLWVYRFLVKYPSSQAAKRAKLKGIIAIKSISETKAKSLKEKANNSVASSAGGTPEMIVSQHCKDIVQLMGEIEMFKNVLIDQYKNSDEVKLLTSANGIAQWSATAFLVEMGDIPRFETSDQLAAFFGVNPSFKQSGDGIFLVKMSKQGSARMRAILYLIAHNLVTHNEYFRALYQKYAAKNKKHKVIMGILMHKALRVLWGMLKNKTAFDPKIDITNQEKNLQPEPVAPISKKARRLQELTIEAPISRSNSKKRKAMLEPQSSIIEEHAGSSKHSLVQT